MGWEVGCDGGLGRGEKDWRWSRRLGWRQDRKLGVRQNRMCGGKSARTLTSSV